MNIAESQITKLCWLSPMSTTERRTVSDKAQTATVVAVFLMIILIGGAADCLAPYC